MVKAQKLRSSVMDMGKMGKEVSSDGQNLQIVGRIAMQVRWKELEKDVMQRILDLSPEDFGRLFTNFMKNGCQFNFFGEQKLFLTESFDPKRFKGLGQGWSLDEDMDPRLKGISEIKVSKIIFETCLKEGETSIIGEEKLLRLEAKPEFIPFGADVFLALWKDYQDRKENSILEALYNSPQKITYLDFMGTPLRYPSGRRDVLYLYRCGDGRWDWLYHWLGSDWGASGLSAGCAST
ncbi:MAG: hypothetical protein V1692_02780 [bacterium]